MEQSRLGRKDLSTDVRRIQGTVGTIYGAGGLVIINSDGIEIIPSTTYANSRSYKFVDTSGDVSARVGAVHDDTVLNYRSADLRVLPHTGLDSVLWIVSESPSGEVSQINIEALYTGGARNAATWHDVSATSTISWEIDTGWMGEIQNGHWFAVLDDNATAGVDVRLQADWELTYPASRREMKTNIADHEVDRAKFARLKVSRYNAAAHPEGPPMVGLIAEDVETVFPDVVVRMHPRPSKRGPRNGQTPPSDEPQAISWDDRQLLVMAVSVIQQQERDIEDLKARVAALEARLG